MTRHSLAALGTLILLPFLPAHAQACLGLTSLATHPTNLTASVEFTDGAKSFSARFGFGSSIAFGGLSGQIIDYDDFDGTSKGIGVDGGLSFLSGAQRNVTFCPVASLSYTSHPDLGIADFSSTDGSAGLALGATLNAGATMKVIPFGVLQGVYSRFSYDSDVASGSDSDTYGILSAGLSFVLTDAFLVRPIANFPLGLEGADPTYGVGVSFAFGRR